MSSKVCPMVVAAQRGKPATVPNGRRKFLRVVLGGGVLASLASFIYPVLRYVLPPATTDLGSDSVLAATVNELKANSAKIFKFGSKPGLLVQTPEGEYRAFSAICTHLDCTVQYRQDEKLIWCACHNGRYDLTGKNVSGPPPRPLEEFKVNVRGGEIIVSRG